MVVVAWLYVANGDAWHSGGCIYHRDSGDREAVRDAEASKVDGEAAVMSRFAEMTREVAMGEHCFENVWVVLNPFSIEIGV
jgi:hypothetical protein